MKRFFLCALLAGACWAQDQDGGQLDRIRGLMADNLRRIPNYTCQMVIDRAIRRSGRNEGLAHVDTLRLEVAEVDGKELVGMPGTKLGEQSIAEIAQGGMTASGDFSHLAVAVFGGKTPKIHRVGEKKLNGRKTVEYAYDISQAASRYEMKVGEMSAVLPYKGSFWVGADGLDLMRMDARVEQFPLAMGMRASVTVIDYQKSRIGDSDFLLPSRVERTATFANGAVTQNITRFTACHQYGTESAIRFDVAPAPSETAAAPVAAVAAAPPVEIHLAAGIRLPLVLQTPIDARKIATGDIVVARLTEDVHVTDGFFPAGSEVQGNIRLLRRLPTDTAIAFEIEFTQIRAASTGATATFTAFLESMEKRKGIERQSAMQSASGINVDEKRFSELSGLPMVWRTLP